MELAADEEAGDVGDVAGGGRGGEAVDHGRSTCLTSCSHEAVQGPWPDSRSGGHGEGGCLWLDSRFDGRERVGRRGREAVSYTHLTLPTIYSV